MATRLLPLASITNILLTLFGFIVGLRSVFLVESKAILLPSGDHAGKSLLSPLKSKPAKTWGLPPSAFTIQMFSPPLGLGVGVPLILLLETKRIRPPSGDQRGLVKPRPVPDTLRPARTLRSEPSAPIVQRFLTKFGFGVGVPSILRSEVKAMVSPSGEKAGRVLPAFATSRPARAWGLPPSEFINQIFSQF